MTQTPIEAQDARVAALIVDRAIAAGRRTKLEADLATAELEYESEGYRPGIGMHPRKIRAIRAELGRRA